jgi:hypothetical protein
MTTVTELLAPSERPVISFPNPARCRLSHSPQGATHQGRCWTSLHLLPFLIYFIYLFIYSTGVWTWGLMLTRRVFFYLSHILIPLCFQLGSPAFCLGWPQTSTLLPTASSIIGITGTHPSHPACLLRWGLANFLTWPWTLILLISAFWVAGIKEWATLPHLIFLDCLLLIKCELY